jgi:hypothetical protein
LVYEIIVLNIFIQKSIKEIINLKNLNLNFI